MLRLTPEVNKDGSIVRLTGRLADQPVREAERVCLSAEAPLLIDEGLSRYLAMRVEALRERGGY